VHASAVQEFPSSHAKADVHGVPPEVVLVLVMLVDVVVAPPCPAYPPIPSSP
jgi:hypothetical protein